MSTLRVKAGLQKISREPAAGQLHEPKEFNKLDRELLRDSFKIVNEFKKFITYHFKLGMIS
jgi:CBS domain-containing protein